MAIQIHEAGTPKKTFGQKLAGGFNQALEIYAQHAEKEKAKKLMDKENQQLQSLVGEDISGLNPELKKVYLSKLMEGQNARAKENKSPQEKAAELKRLEIVQKYFGNEAADIYDAAPEGGKTALIQSFMDNAQRGQNFGDLISSQNPNAKTETGNEENPSAIKAVDYDKNLTPKERVKRQEDRYAKNLPLYQQNQTKLQALQHEADSLETLAELSPKISGWERLNINPSTGALLIPAAASADAQRFAKTVNDFTVNAKDSFGARVSNFELDRFMQRLPTLANSEEGRAQIIRQMQIINQMNSLRNQTLKDVFEEHGGVRNIDYDQAERMADKITTPKIDSLKKEFRRIDSSLGKEYDKKIEGKKKKMLAPGRVMIEKNGEHFSIPKNQLKDAMQEGYKAL